MPINSASIKALQVARSLKHKRKGYAGGGAPSNPALWDLPEEEIPHQDISARRGVENVAGTLGHVAKSIFWDTPKAMVDAAKTTPYGLRREDYTDIPPDTSPDPNSPLGGVGIVTPRGAGSHLDPMIRPGLETATNVMGGTALSGAREAARANHVLGFQLGAGPRDPRLWHGISKVKLPKPIDEMSAVHVPTGEVAERVIAPSTLQGGRLLPLIGDRTGASTRLTQVNGYKLENPVEMQGGHSFMAANADKGAAWASGLPIARRLGNVVRREAGDDPLYGVYTAMGERPGDFSHHVSDTLAEMYQHVKVPKAARASFDMEMRAIAPDWPGINSQKLRPYLAAAPGELRSQFAKLMDTAKYQSQGFPSVAEARFATTDPRLLNEQTGAAGLSVARMDPSGKTFQTPGQHLTYDTNVGGQYVGGFGTSIPKEVMFPDIVNPLEKYRAALPGYKPTVDYLMQRTPKGLPLVQKADQKWVDTVSKHLEDRGFKLGAGATDKRAASLSAVDDVLAREKALAPQWYSQLDRAMEGVTQPAMTPEQWMGTLRNAGVKQEELDWRGISKLLQEKAGQPISREEMAAHLQANPMPQLKPVEMAAAKPFDDLTAEERRLVEREFDRRYDGEDPRYVPEVEKFYDDMVEAGKLPGGGGAARYGEYALPGGESYRERLLTLPGRREEALRAATEARLKYGLHSPEHNRALKAVPSDYKSSHWDEPNVLVHRRSTDRNFDQPFTPEQQAAIEARRLAEDQLNDIRRQQGMLSREISAIARPLENARKDKILADIKAGKISGPDGMRALEEFVEYPQLFPLQDKMQALRAQEDAIRKAMPEAPKPESIRSLHLEEIQSDWHQAGRKRGYRGEPLQYGSRIEGYTPVGYAWDKTTRPNVNHVIHQLKDAQGRVIAEGSDRVEALRKSGLNPAVPDAPFKKNWHEVAAKDMLREAAEGGYPRISWTAGRSQPTNPKNLQPGVDRPEYEAAARGMEGFYDKMVVDYLNKLGKPHGVKVERATLPNVGPMSGEMAMDRMGIPRAEQKAFWDDLVNSQPHGAREVFLQQARDKGHDVFYMDIPQSLKDEALHKGFRLGAGATDKRAAGLAAVDDVLDAERRLSGAPRGPGPAAAVPTEPAPAGTAPAVGPGGGGAAGVRSLPEAQATAARWAGERKPLEGIPGPLKIGGDYFVPGPIGKVHDVAEDYMRSVGREYAPPTKYHPIDPEHSKAIAQAYEEMKHTPKDPATVASYNALIDETKAQYEAIKKTGLKIEPIPAGAADPYAANPRLAAIDVAENNHLWFFPTEQGFGTLNKISDNPMLRKTGEKIGDMELTANDMFRVVHDYFGHLKEGHGFRAAGEDNAWRTHSAMYSDLARPAMTTETRGQNSWVNYGPHGEKNRTASGADTVYADQKVGLMPNWTMYDKGAAPIEMYHGSAADYLQPDLSKIGTGQGQMAYGAGYYGSSKEKVAKSYRDMQAKHRIMKAGKPSSASELYGDIYNKLMSAGADPRATDAAAARIVDMMEDGMTLAKMRQFSPPVIVDPKEWELALKAAKGYANQRFKGHMYQWAVEADPEKLLDWNQTLSKHSGYVQDRLTGPMEKSVKDQLAAIDRKIAQIKSGNHPYKGRPGGDVQAERELERLQVLQGTLDARNLTGREMYRRSGLPAASEEEAYKQASPRLLKAGIPGLRYRDPSTVSKAADIGVPNFVIWDPKVLRLLRKYGVAGTIPTGVAAGAMQQDQGYAAGGKVGAALQIARSIKRARGGKVHVGPIMGDTGGRADKVKMEVPDGSYVLTADHVSGMGEGNTLAGFKKLKAMFPQSCVAYKALKAGGPVKRGAVPIYAADGEFVISPEEIISRWGDLDEGHRILDEWQTSERKKLIRELATLAPPAQD